MITSVKSEMVIGMSYSYTFQSPKVAMTQTLSMFVHLLYNNALGFEIEKLQIENVKTEHKGCSVIMMLSFKIVTNYPKFSSSK